MQSGVYTLEGPIYIYSNTILTGDEGTILRVSSSSSQWFHGRVGLITNDKPIHDVILKNIQLDGNCQNLPKGYANYDGIHDGERGIYFNGLTNEFCYNITIINVKVYDTFSDGLHINYARNVHISKFCGENNQHEGIFLVCVLGGLIEDIEDAGITSDCLRFDNCQDLLIQNGKLSSYSGNHNNGAYEHGENGIQIGDETNSGGLKGGTAKPYPTKNIEVRNITFIYNGLRALFLDGRLTSSDNVYIHDNIFIGKKGTETSGTPANFSYIDVTYTNSLDTNDLLSQVFQFKYINSEIPISTNINVTYYNNSYNPHSLVYVDGEGLTGIKYEYGGLFETHYLVIDGAVADVWTGDLQHTGNAVYLQGNFDASKLRVTCYNSQGYHEFTNFNITEVPDDSAKVVFNPELWAFVGTLIILGFSIYKNFRRVVTKW